MLMKEGDCWRLTIPPALGYGSRGSGPIPGDSVLVFKLELLKVKADAGMPWYVEAPLLVVLAGLAAVGVYLGCKSRIVFSALAASLT